MITPGFKAIIHINTSTSECVVKNVIGILDPKTGKIDKNMPPILKPGHNALVEFECVRDICVNKFAEESFLGRVLLRLETQTIGIGQVVKVCYDEPPK